MNNQSLETRVTNLENLLRQMFSRQTRVEATDPGNHASLTNLAYAAAGHTGFEPAVTKGNVTAGSTKISLGGTPTGAAFKAFSIDVDQTKLDHGSIGGLTDDDHTQYIKHVLSTAGNDFLVGSGSNTYIKKTLAETKTILGIAGANVTAGSNKISLGGTPTGAAIVAFSIDVDQTKLDHDSLLNYAANKHSKIRTFTWIVSLPATGRIPGPRVPEGYTATRLDCYVASGNATVTFNIEECSVPGVAGTNIMTNDLVGDANGVNTTTFSNAGLAAGSWLWLDISATANTPTQAVITLTCEIT
jgi:hypothetical protein